MITRKATKENRSMQCSSADLIPYSFDVFFRRCRQLIDTLAVRLYFNWWNIKLGRHSKFTGFPLVHKHPTGKITIGNHAFFRSAEWSNNLGVNRRCFLSAGHDAKVTIGDHCGFSGTTIAASQSITIGNRVLCGVNCTVTDTDRHPINCIARANNEEPEISPIVIEDDVWLGMNVVILKGVTIGRGTILAANSVVTKSLPCNVIAGGIPAKVIKSL